jgi:hypothetical protein
MEPMEGVLFFLLLPFFHHFETRRPWSENLSRLFFCFRHGERDGWDRVSDITRDLIGPLPFTFEGWLVGDEEPGWLCTRHCAELKLSHGW